MYALTDEDGTKTGNVLEGLITVMNLNGAILVLIVLYEYVLKPAIFRPTTRPQAASSVTSQDAFHLPHDNSNTINAL